jgi:signal transduction histidine kinase/DNA-binding response OmpR family regulator
MRGLKGIRGGVLGWLLIAITAHGAPLEITKIYEDSRYDLHKALYFFKETEPLTIHQVQSLSHEQWQRHAHKPISTLPKDLPMWIKIPIHTYEDISHDWILNLDESSGPDGQFYVFENGKLLQQHSINGLVSFNTRPIQHRLPIIPIRLNKQKSIEIFIKLQKSAGFSLSFSLIPSYEFYEKDALESLLIAMHLGLILGILIYHLVLFATTSNISYAVYSFYLATILLVTLRISGLGYQYLWPETPWMVNEGRNLSFSLSAISATIFAIYFLQVRLFSKIMYMALHSLWIFMAVSCLFTFQDFHLIRQLQIPLQVSSYILLIVSGLMAMAYGYSYAKFYVLSWAIFVAAGIWFALNVLGIFPYEHAARGIVRLGIDLQVILMALALGYRVKKLQSDRFIAEAENKAKSDFLAKMSHEIRTPMSGVLGMAELLGERLKDETSIRYNNIIKASGHSLLTIINDILDYSKIEAGKMELERVPFNIEKLAVETLDTFKQLALEKNIELIIDINKDQPKNMLGDPVRLKQIILNFVNNAIKFTDTGHVLLRIEPVKNDQSQTKISVEDTGPGISIKNQNRLFQAFNQADSSVARHYGGTGLGLIICKQISILMKGSIGVESIEGKGSTFWVSLCIDENNETTEAPEAPSKDLQGHRILIADDNFTFAEILKETVKNWNMIPTLAHDGKEVLDELEKAHGQNQMFDLISLDLFMPLMNGLEASRSIEADPRFNQVPRILLTSADSLPAKQDLKQAGIFKAMVKPSLAAELHDAFCQAISGAPQKVDPIQNIGIQQDAIKIKNLNILVAEDNKVNQMVITALLKKMSQSPTLVENGQEALDLLSDPNHTVDLVLMDCSMPVMDGYEATRAIREMEKKLKRPAIRIVALSAHVMEEQRNACIEAGMNDYLSKPIETPELIRVLNQHAQ